MMEAEEDMQTDGEESVFILSLTRLKVRFPLIQHIDPLERKAQNIETPEDIKKRLRLPRYKIIDVTNN
jgi:hypothetical protein